MLQNLARVAQLVIYGAAVVSDGVKRGTLQWAWPRRCVTGWRLYMTADARRTLRSSQSKSVCLGKEALVTDGRLIEIAQRLAAHLSTMSDSELVAASGLGLRQPRQYGVQLRTEAALSAIAIDLQRLQKDAILHIWKRR